MSGILVQSAREFGRAMGLQFFREREAPPAEGDLQHATGGHGLDGDEWVKALPYERTLETAP